MAVGTNALPESSICSLGKVGQEEAIKQFKGTVGSDSVPESESHSSIAFDPIKHVGFRKTTTENLSPLGTGRLSRKGTGPSNTAVTSPGILELERSYIKEWVKSTAHFLLCIFRFLLIPLWVIITTFNYVFILIMVNFVRIFGMFPTETEEAGDSDDGVSIKSIDVWKVIGLTLTVPLSIIYDQTDVGSEESIYPKAKANMSGAKGFMVTSSEYRTWCRFLNITDTAIVFNLKEMLRN